MSDEAWDDFREVAFGEPYLVWHDGPSFQDLRDLWVKEPERVERMLLAGLAEGDALAAQSMGELQDVAGGAAQRFEAALRAALAGSHGTHRVRIAESLRAFTGSAEWDRYVAASLAEPNFWTERINAAIALRHTTPTPEIIAVLQAGARDEDYLVRYHSANSLLAFAGSGLEVDRRDDLFDDLVADEAERWARVAAVLADEARAALPD